MEVMLVLKAVAALGGLGLVFGSLLEVTSRKFAVEVDPRVSLLLAVLPGANCGACGLPGCEAAAEAIASGKIPIDSCVAGGQETLEAVARVMGVEVTTLIEPFRAFIRCGGGRGKVSLRFLYDGVADCVIAEKTTHGDLACSYGCLGLGSCVKSCPFDALSIGENHLPVVNWAKCTGCGICVSICPRKIISLVPEKAQIGVACNSKDKGPVVRKICQVGCIACNACVKVCESGAITLVDNLAIIDYKKCTFCGKCIEKCPTKCIVLL